MRRGEEAGSSWYPGASFRTALQTKRSSYARAASDLRKGLKVSSHASSRARGQNRACGFVDSEELLGWLQDGKLFASRG